jgi:hypothetical protein
VRARWSVLVVLAIAIPGVSPAGIHLWDHRLGYVVAIFFAIIPFAAMRQVLRASAPKSSLAGCLTALVAVGAAGVLVMWLYAVVLLSELWLPWVLLLATVSFLLGALVAKRWTKRIRSIAPSA